MQTLENNTKDYKTNHEETFIDRYEIGPLSNLPKEVSSLEKTYSVFAEQFLEKLVIEEDNYSPIRAMGSWLIPTLCTWRGIPTIDDCDDL